MLKCHQPNIVIFIIIIIVIIILHPKLSEFFVLENYQRALDSYNIIIIIIIHYLRLDSVETRLEQNSGKLSQTSTELTQQGLIMVNLKGLSNIFKLMGFFEHI